MYMHAPRSLIKLVERNWHPSVIPPSIRSLTVPNVIITPASVQATDYRSHVCNPEPASVHRTSSWPPFAIWAYKLWVQTTFELDFRTDSISHISRKADAALAMQSSFQCMALESQSGASADKIEKIFQVENREWATSSPKPSSVG